MIDMQLIENGILTGGVLFTLFVFSSSLYFFLQDVYQQNIRWDEAKKEISLIAFALFVSFIAMIILTVIGTVVYILIDFIGIV